MSDSILLNFEDVPFKTISLYHVDEDPLLSWKAVGVLTYLLSRPQSAEKPWKFWRTDLVNRHSDGVASVKSALKELRDRGYLRMKAQHGGGWEWMVSHKPRTAEEWATRLALTKAGNRTDETSKVDFTPAGNDVGAKTGRIPKSSTSNQEVLEPALFSSVEVEAQPPDRFSEIWDTHPRGNQGKAHGQYRKATYRNGKPPRIDHDTMLRCLQSYVETEGVGRRGYDGRVFSGMALFRWIRDDMWHQELAKKRKGGTPKPEPLEPGTAAWAEAEYDRIMKAEARRG